MKKYIGLDIGLNGGIAIVKDSVIIEKYKMPTIGKTINIKVLKDILLLHNTSTLVFEDLGVIFGSSKATAFSMGYQVGIIEALATALNIPFIKVKARVWQKEMFQGVTELKKGTKRDTKGMALVTCQRLFPDYDLTFSSRATVPHDGLVDSILIASYAQRKNL
jgi:hypothetical protein